MSYDSWKTTEPDPPFCQSCGASTREACRCDVEDTGNEDEPTLEQEYACDCAARGCQAKPCRGECGCRGCKRAYSDFLDYE